MTKDLTSGSPLKVILLFSLPLVLGNLFQQFYALADTIIVGRFCGVSALASVGATGSVNYLILGFVIGVCNGFAIPIAQLFGARDYKDLRRHVANAAWLCMAASVVLTISTVALTRPMMQLMQTPDDIIDGAVIYIGWIFAGIPFIFLYNMVAAIMRALGDSKTPLYFLILTSALNIGLEYLGNLVRNFDKLILRVPIIKIFQIDSSHRKILHFSLFGVGRKRNGVMAENGTAPRDTLSRSLESKIRLRDTRPHKRTKIYYRLCTV